MSSDKADSKEAVLRPKLEELEDLMDRLNLKQVKLDNQGRIVKLVYRDVPSEKPLTVKSLDKLIKEEFLDPQNISALPQNIQVAQPEFASPMDDPDMWPDGKKPTFNKE